MKLHAYVTRSFEDLPIFVSISLPRYNLINRRNTSFWSQNFMSSFLNLQLKIKQSQIKTLKTIFSPLSFLTATESVKFLQDKTTKPSKTVQILESSTTTNRLQCRSKLMQTTPTPSSLPSILRLFSLSGHHQGHSECYNHCTQFHRQWNWKARVRSWDWTQLWKRVEELFDWMVESHHAF